MQPPSVASPMLTLPYDALDEVALKLPAVKSEKPWRDLNSLATTCKLLYKWKKRKVVEDIKLDWNKVKKNFFGESSLRIGLENFIREYKNSSMSLFFEPILRNIDRDVESTHDDKKNDKYRHLKNQIFFHREVVSINEIKDLLKANKEAHTNTKIKILSRFPSFFPILKSTDRQQALRLMFNLLDENEKLGISLNKNGIFEQIEVSLNEDDQSKVLLELGLHSRNLHSDTPNIHVVRFGLSSIPDTKRWNWVLSNVPECLDTKLGLLAMLNDPVCQSELVNYLKNSFLECTDDFDKLKICGKVSKIYNELEKLKIDEDLSKMAVKWILKAPLCINPMSNHLNPEYVAVLLEYLPGIQKCFGKNEKKILWKKFYRSIEHSSKYKAFDQATSLLIAMAKDDIKIFKDFGTSSSWVTDQEVLKCLLAHASELHASHNRDKFLRILMTVAHHHHRDSDPAFFNGFVEAVDKINKNRSISEKKGYQGDGASASES